MDANSKRSQTAEAAAAARALLSFASDPEVRNPDVLAKRLIGPLFWPFANVAPLRSVARLVSERRLPGLIGFHTARTKHFDAILRDVVAAGATQFVLLGAGLDSRAYRLRDVLANVKVFEVDHPATQAWKRARLQRALPDAFGHVEFVSVDFSRDVILARLKEHGFDPTKRTFFLWEGVTMYLPEGAVDETLAMVAACAPGSSIAFDYFYRAAGLHPQRFPGLEHEIADVAKRGEPFVFWLDPSEIGDFLARRGLSLVSNRRAEELEAYLRTKSGALVAPTLSFAGIAHGGVAPRST